MIDGHSGPKKSEGYLGTVETFKDFRVRGTFKMLGSGNYGLFYHSSITLKDDGYPVISGLQGEVAGVHGREVRGAAVGKNKGRGRAPPARQRRPQP